MSDRATHWKMRIAALVWLAAVPLVIEGGLLLTLAYLAGTAWLLVTRGFRHASQRFSCELTIDSDRLSVGEQGKVIVTAHYCGSLPVRNPVILCSFPTGLKPVSPTRVAPRLDSHGQAVAEFLFEPVLRGRYRVGHAVATLEDSVGLTQRTATVLSCHDLLVYPRVCSVDKLGIPSRLPFGERTYRIPVLRYPEYPATMRQYFRRTRTTWGGSSDGRGSPHIVVKEVRSTDSTQTMIFLDLCERDYDGLGTHTHGELAISVAASLALHIHLTGESVGLSLLSRPGSVEPSLEEPLRKGTSRVYLPPGNGNAHLGSVLEVLATVRGPRQGHFGECLAYGMRSMAFATKMVIVAPTDTDDVRNYASWAVRKGHRAVVVICGPSMQRGRDVDRVTLVHIPADALARPSAAIEAREWTRRVVNA